MVVLKNQCKKILLIRIDRLGDLILTLPAIKAIRESCCDAEIDIVVNSAFQGFMQQTGLVTNIIPCSSKNLVNLFDIVYTIRKKDYDLAIDLTPASTYVSSFFLFLSRAKEKAGYAVGIRKFFLTKPIRPPKAMIYERDMVLEICHQLDIPIKDNSLFFHVSKTNRKEIEKRIDSILQHSGLFNKEKRNKKIIAVHPGASRPEKCWETNAFIALFNKLLINDPSLCFVFLGTGDEIHKIKEINNALIQKQTILVDKFSILELGIFLAQCRLLICSNSGPMNVGAAVGTPLVVINLVSSEERWAPRGDHVRVVSASTEDLEFLHREKEQLKPQISLDKIYNACKDLLK